ncbi:SphA family protein [Paracoccus aestuariivivens]|nr:transporter [Paracoccus aestuariivivens]
MRRFKRNSLKYVLSGIVLAAAAGQANAVENGAGMYILGSRTSMGGVVAPPGTYTQQSYYLYSGSNGGEIVNSGKLQFGIEGRAAIGLTSVLWVPPSEPVLGGSPYFSLTLPYGYKKSDIEGTLTAPGGTVLSGSKSEDSFLFGDPVFGAGLGWGKGPFFGSLNMLINVPIGDYSTSRSTNVAFNHWAYDFTGAVTWMDADSGWQANFATGVTFNEENDATNYKSGDELHVEASVGKAINPNLTLSLQGYYYKQISGDSGSGAFLGDFKGEATALGPAVAWNSDWNGTPVALEARWFHEFNVKNRLEGDAVLFNMTIPLGG